MQYMLLIYDNEQSFGSLSGEEIGKMIADYAQFTESVQKGGQFKDAARLQPSGSATSVRVREGKRLVTAGPFAETREQLGGYYLIEAKDLDEALAIAEQVPSAKRGTIEVRPVMAM